MKRSALIVALGLLTASPAFAVRCGTKIVSEGDTRSEVAAKNALAEGATDTAFHEAKLQRARFQAEYLGGELPRWLSAVERSRAELPFLPTP